MKYLKKEQKIEKTFESFIGNILGNNKYDGLENISKPTDEVDSSTKNRILDIETFNTWLREDYSYGGYNGAPGLIGRVDKLSYAMVVAYFLDQGVECTDQEIYGFQEEIRKNWNN